MRKISILIFLTVITICSYGQLDTFHVTQNAYIINNLDTSTNASFTIFDSIYYTGSSASYNDSVTFGAYINSTLATDTNFVPPLFTPADTFFNGVAIPVAFVFTNDSALPFEIGPNTVVIWPIYRNVSGSSPGYTGYFDSIRITANYYPLGIAESPLAKMFIFETPGHLNINFGDAENLVQQVRIYNTVGQRMYADSPDRSKNIQTSGWATGIYICEIRTFSGETRTFKFRLE